MKTKHTTSELLELYGRVMCDAQILELKLSARNSAIYATSVDFDLEKLVAYKQNHMKAPFRGLLKEFKKQEQVHDSVDAFLEKVKEQRDYLAHRFFVENRDLLEEAHIPRFMAELNEIGLDIRRAEMLLSTLKPSPKIKSE